MRQQKALSLISPTYPNSYGRVAVIPSDFNAQLAKELAPYNTIGNQNFLWRATLDTGLIQQVAGSDVTGAINFQLSQFPGNGDFSTAFDQYRLRAASVTVSPFYDFANNGSATGLLISPRLWTVIDYDDSATVTRIQAESYDTCVASPPSMGVIRTLVPRMAGAVYSGTFTSFANFQDLWLDMASPNVQHYGVKYVIEAAAVAQTNLQSYTVSVTGFWELRATR